MQSPLSHVLFITKIAPFPPYGGEKIRSIELMKLFSTYADRLTVICPQVPAAPDRYRISDNVHFIPIKPVKRSKYAQMVYNRAGYFLLDSSVVDCIDKAIEAEAVDMAVVDYEFLGQHIPFLRKKGIPKIVYGTHNSQSQLVKQHRKPSLLGRVNRRIKYLMHSLHERIYFPQADQLIVVSEEDADFHADFVDRSKIVVLPNFLDEHIYQISDSSKSARENRVVMTANFLSFQNIAGARWFLQHVWKEPISNHFDLVLAGIGSKEFLERFQQEFATPPNCVAWGEVEDVKEIIANSTCAIVPLIHGSGSRLKILEALALGTPIIATRIGAEGIDHQGTIMIADTPGQFTECFSQVRSMSEEAYAQRRKQLREVFYEKYSQHASRAIARKIVSTVDAPVKVR